MQTPAGRNAAKLKNISNAFSKSKCRNRFCIVFYTNRIKMYMLILPGFCFCQWAFCINFLKTIVLSASSSHPVPFVEGIALQGWLKNFLCGGEKIAQKRGVFSKIIESLKKMTRVKEIILCGYITF